MAAESCGSCVMVAVHATLSCLWVQICSRMELGKKKRKSKPSLLGQLTLKWVPEKCCGKVNMAGMLLATSPTKCGLVNTNIGVSSRCLIRLQCEQPDSLQCEQPDTSTVWTAQYVYSVDSSIRLQGGQLITSSVNSPICLQCDQADTSTVWTDSFIILLIQLLVHLSLLKRGHHCQKPLEIIQTPLQSYTGQEKKKESHQLQETNPGLLYHS